MSAEPAPCMTDLTSAKSRLMRPGVVMRSVMPCTPARSTWSAVAKASTIEMPRSLISRRRSFGTTMSVSTSSLSPATPFSAWDWRRLPSKLNGFVTTPMVRAPIDFAMRATTAHHPYRSRHPHGGDEDHVGTRQGLLDLLGVVLGGTTADLGVRAGAEAAGDLAADVELDVGVAEEQCLRVGVDRDELDPTEAELDHPVDGVDAAAADTDDLDDGEVVVVRGHVSQASGRTLNLYLKFRGNAGRCVLASTLRVRSAGCRPATPRVARFRYFFARMIPLSER